MPDKEQELLTEIIDTLKQFSIDSKLGNKILLYSEKTRIAGQIIAKLKSLGYEQVWEKCPDCEGGEIADYLTKICQFCEYKGVDEGGKFMCCCLTVCPHADKFKCPTCKGTGKVNGNTFSCSQ